MELRVQRPRQGTLSIYFRCERVWSLYKRAARLQMFPFLQFVNPAGRDSCLLLRGFLAKKEAGSSVSDRVFLESRSSCCTTSITSSSWPTLRWLPLLKRSRLWSANLPERTTCPPNGGGEVRGPASILPGSAAGGAGCGQLPETLETLGGGAVLRDWEGGL